MITHKQTHVHIPHIIYHIYEYTQKVVQMTHYHRKVKVWQEEVIGEQAKEKH